MGEHFRTRIFSRCGEHGEEHEIVRKYNDLTHLRFAHNPPRDVVLSLVILGRNGVIKDDAGIRRV